MASEGSGSHAAGAGSANSEYEVFDADGVVFGRLASSVAKRLLTHSGTVIVLNTEKAIITGSRHIVASRYAARIRIKDKINPEHSPYWSRRPDLLFKRMVRGMLPFKDARGKLAYRRLRAFVGAPAQYAGMRTAQFPRADLSSMYVEHMSLGELSAHLGYKRSGNNG